MIIETTRSSFNNKNNENILNFYFYKDDEKDARKRFLY